MSGGRARLPLSTGPATVVLHGHCHQKAMGRVAPAKALLTRIPGATVVDPDAGCCGMAGSFGYTRDHFDVSRAIGERRLLPVARQLDRGRRARGERRRPAVSRSPISRGRAPCTPPSSSNRSCRGVRMNLAVLSVSALALAVIVSCVSRLNVGVLAVALAWIVGVYIGGMPVNAVMGGFPSQLFLTLAGVTLLFALAQSQRHARAPHASRRAVVPRQPRRRFRSCSSCWARRCRRWGPATSRRPRSRADRDGHGRAHPASRCS